MRIAVLEDEPMMLKRITDILESWDQSGHVYPCTSNEDFAGLLDAGTQIDILLADLDLPDGSGCQSIDKLTSTHPASLAIAVSAMSDGASVCAAILAGAVGYLHKDDHSTSVIKTINDALEGQSPISPSIAQTLVGQIKSGGLRKPKVTNQADTDTSCLLTERQVEVLSTIAKGYSYEETARLLGISKNTIPTHIRNIYKRLHARNKSEAIYEARLLGLIE